MKIERGVHKGKNREATAINKIIKTLIKKHGVELVRYVSNRIINKELDKKKLEREIRSKENELDKLRNKR